MGIWEHLNELRKRLFKALVAMITSTILVAVPLPVLSFSKFPPYISISNLPPVMLAEQMINFMAMPIGGVDKLISIEVTENISVFFRVSLLCGFIIALPIILYQILAFVSPGLTSSERRSLLLAIPFATLMFVLGVAFAYLVMLPAALPFLVSFIGIRTTPRLDNYYRFLTNLLFWIGVSFETPLVVFILAKFKLVTASMLAKQWRIVIVVIAVISAAVTPTPDPINMGLLMLPLFILYLFSLLLALLAR